METQTRQGLTEQDIRMLWSIRDGKLPELGYNNQIRILGASVDYSKLNQDLEKTILIRRNWGEVTLGEKDGKLASIDGRDSFLGVAPEVVYAHAKAMGRKNTWANRRWRDRSDNFFGEGFHGPEYSVMPFAYKEDKPEKRYIAVDDMIVPSRLKIVLPEAVARKYFSERLQKEAEVVKQLEGRLGDMAGKEIPARDLPVNGYEINGCWGGLDKTHPVFSPLWAHNPHLNKEKIVVAPLYLEVNRHEETVYHIKESDMRAGQFGELRFSPLLSNGQPADAEALQKYEPFLWRRR